MVVVTARGDECRAVAHALSYFKAEHAAVELEGTLEVSHLQVDMADADLGVDGGGEWRRCVGVHGGLLADGSGGHGQNAPARRGYPQRFFATRRPGNIPMTTRREFFQTAAGSLGCAAALASGSLAAARDGAPDDAPPQPYRQDRPLLELQEAFLDLRFGMFLHFNMATFQDREWGDPEGPTAAFDPSSLDTDLTGRGDAGQGAGTAITRSEEQVRGIYPQDLCSDYVAGAYVDLPPAGWRSGCTTRSSTSAAISGTTTSRQRRSPASRPS